MASNLNSVCIVGNLTRAPETREVGSDNSVTTLRVAVNDRRKVDGEWTDVAGYYNVEVWGAQGVNCEKFLDKGRPVGVQGRLQWREWQDKEGNNRQDISIVANSVQFLGSRDDNGSAPSSDTPDEPVSGGTGTPKSTIPFAPSVI